MRHLKGSQIKESFTVRDASYNVLYGPFHYRFIAKMFAMLSGGNVYETIERWTKDD